MDWLTAAAAPCCGRHQLVDPHTTFRIREAELFGSANVSFHKSIDHRMVRVGRDQSRLALGVFGISPEEALQPFRAAWARTLAPSEQTSVFC